MLNLHEAHELVARHVLPVQPERVPLDAACGRGLREAVAADADIPGFDRSAMDGYALRGDDDSLQFRVVAEIPAGACPSVRIGMGECARVFTGSAIPEGATQVVVQEVAQRSGDTVTFTRRDKATNIRRRGEDARRGDLLLNIGTLLRPVELSLLAQLGCTAPLLAGRPRILHVVTGSELVPPGEKPGPGQIRDSNSTMIAALVAAAGAAMTAQKRAGDDADTLLSAIRGVPVSEWDMLLISGGAGGGDFDCGRRAIEELGFTLHFDSLNLRPGKPLVFATRDRQAAFVIPGNPLSHFVCWHTVIRPALDVLALGALRFNLVTLPVGGSHTLSGHPRETWWPARLHWESAGPIAEPLRWQSSGDLTRLVGVNTLLRIPSNHPPTAPGGRLEALILDAEA
jgi:molybdopterin molybdotransferase